ncbi:hypothetical protein [Marinobacterium litorale]|uniref:hypothetical protein n=1 Tax=Marinobacterium litorale TaxID=404770 RepID=UPI00040206AB|nr:hypothetical protein [Marinobacterium litorale]
MANADNALLRMESGQQAYPMAALTDSGDRTVFTSAASPWSGKTGYEPVVRPNGLINGGAVTPASSGSDNVVDVAALTCYLAGAQESVAADTDVTCARPTVDTHLIYSITVTAAGAIAAVAGSEGTSFTETRAAAGGPPLIPVDSIEIGQVRLSSQTAAPVVASEIFQTVGLHQERYDYPTYTVDSFRGRVSFAAALAAVHTGSVGKAVYASYATPIFADLPKARDFVAPEESFSISSEAYYGGSEGSVSRSLGQGSFTQLISDGVTDPVVKAKGENLWFDFYPNKFRAPHVMSQGVLGISRTWPASGSMTAACTISASDAASEVES